MKNILKSWKTSILGLVLLSANVYYILFAQADIMIFALLLLVSFALFFAPDDLIRGVKRLIEKNQEKEL